MKIRELAEWCKTTFRSYQAPKESTISLCFQTEPSASLLHKLETSCPPNVMRQSSIYALAVRYLEMQTKLLVFEWGYAMVNIKAIFNDELLR